jgi:hypothetical protein
MDLLQQFYENHPMREEIRKFFDSTIDSLALRKLYAGKEAKDFAGAKEAIAQAFLVLKETYEPVKKVKIISNR